MHRKHGLRPAGDRVVDQVLVEVDGVRADVDEDRCASTEHYGVCSRDEVERRHDDLVTALDLEQKRCHLERRRGGVHKQRSA